MEIKKITEAIEEWHNLTSRVLDLKKLAIVDIQKALKKTYKILKTFSTDELVPKEVSKLLLCMDEFLYFSSIIEDKDVPIDFFHYQAIYNIASAIKNGFFDAGFEYYFTNAQTDKLYAIDMEQNGVKDYLEALNNKTCTKSAGIKLI